MAMQYCFTDIIDYCKLKDNWFWCIFWGLDTALNLCMVVAKGKNKSLSL